MVGKVKIVHVSVDNRRSQEDEHVAEDVEGDGGRVHGGRWERLFDDLEVQVEAELRAELDGQVAELTRASRGEVLLADRLRASAGHEVSLHLLGGASVRGVVRECVAQWLLLAGERGSGLALVPLHAVVSAEGLSRYAAPGRSGVGERLTLRSVLRVVARDRSPVRLWLVDGRLLHGTIDRVGQDHLDLAEHHLDEPRRAAAVRQRHAVPFSAVSLVRPPESASSLVDW